jgi:Trk K+ transport system NAD-binding subunit
VHTQTVRAIHLLRTGFEVIELEAEEGARIVGRGIGDTHGMLRGCRVGAILRNQDTIIPRKGTQIQAGDRILMLGVAGALTGVEPFFARRR